MFLPFESRHEGSKQIRIAVCETAEGILAARGRLKSPDQAEAVVYEAVERTSFPELAVDGELRELRMLAWAEVERLAEAERPIATD